MIEQESDQDFFSDLQPSLSWLKQIETFSLVKEKVYANGLGEWDQEDLPEGAWEEQTTQKETWTLKSP